MTVLQIRFIDGTPLIDIPLCTSECPNEKDSASNFSVKTLDDIMKILLSNPKFKHISDSVGDTNAKNWCLVVKGKSGKWQKIHKLAKKMASDYVKFDIFVANQKIFKSKAGVSGNASDGDGVGHFLAKNNNVVHTEGSEISSASDIVKPPCRTGEDSSPSVASAQVTKLVKEEFFYVLIGTVTHYFKLLPQITFSRLRRKLVQYLVQPSDEKNYYFFFVFADYEILVNENVLVQDYLKMGGHLVFREPIFGEKFKEVDAMGSKYMYYWKPRVRSFKLCDVLHYLGLIQEGFELTLAEKRVLVDLYILRDPLLVAMIGNQLWICKSHEDEDGTSSNSDFFREKEKGDDNEGIRLCFPGLKSPKITGCDINMFSEHTERIIIKNFCNRSMGLDVYVQASKGDFVGYKLCKKALFPNEETRLTLSIVPLSPFETRGLVIISGSRLDGEGGYEHHLIEYYFGVKYLNKEENCGYFVVQLNELIENKEKVLGYGTNSVVYEAMLYNQKVACKVIKEYMSLFDMNIFEGEVLVLSDINLRHPGIVKFYGASKWRPFRVLIERMDFSLSDLLAVKDGSERTRYTYKCFTLERRVEMALRLASALNHIHMQGYVHRDFKSPNIMINACEELENEELEEQGEQGKQCVVAKLIDFSSSEKLEPEGMMTGEIGTIPWMAPEILKNVRYNQKVDVYSFGITMIELFADFSILDRGQLDIDSNDLKAILDAILKRFPEKVNVITKIARLIYRCTCRVPENRCNTTELCHELCAILKNFSI